MYVVQFQIAGLIIRLVLPYVIETSRAFRPFVCESDIADCIVRFEKQTHVIRPKGTLVKRDVGFDVVAIENDVWMRCYEECSGERKFLLTESTEKDGSVLVKFSPESQQYLRTTDHAFFYMAMEEQLLRHGRWIIHASCIKTPMGVVLFVGPSGIGKTTQAELWEKYRKSKVLNGDRTIVYRKNGIWYAAGSPYAGSSKRYVNESAPICLVALLDQGTDNRVQALTPGQAFRGLYPHLTVNDWNPWYVETITDQLDQFVREQPVVHFSCTPDEAAVDALWKELTKEVDHG